MNENFSVLKDLIDYWNLYLTEYGVPSPLRNGKKDKFAIVLKALEDNRANLATITVRCTMYNKGDEYVMEDCDLYEKYLISKESGKRVSLSVKSEMVDSSRARLQIHLALYFIETFPCIFVPYGHNLIIKNCHNSVVEYCENGDIPWQ